MTFAEKLKLANRLDALRKARDKDMAQYASEIAAVVDLCDHSERIPRPRQIAEDDARVECAVCGKDVSDKEYRHS